MKFNWDQSGMPVALVSRLGRRNEFAEFKSVLSDAQNQVLQPVDVDAMARALAESGGREFVEMVRELTADLANAKKDLEEANLRYERLVADLRRRGVRFGEGRPSRRKVQSADAAASGSVPSEAASEWDEWNRRFQSLLG